ncbi:MAG: EAL domain-containing protein [Ideonella sp.]
MHLTPLAMAVNVANAGVICLVTWSQVSHTFLLGWSAAICGLAALGLRGWLHGRGRSRRTASMRGMRRAVVQASALSALWAVLPLSLLAKVDTGAQFIVGMVVTGMVCAGGFALSTVPAAATAWVVMLGTGSVLALWRSGMSVAGGAALMLGLYCCIVIFSAWSWARSFGARLVAEARADRQNEVIGLLLRDFEDHASDLLWELDARGRFRHVSQRLASTLGVTSGVLRGLSATRLLSRAIANAGEDGVARWAALQQLMARGTAVREHLVAFAGVDGLSWWSISTHPLLDAKGCTEGWRGVAANVTDKHQAHLRLTWLAHNDALTGLVNRTQFRELLQTLLAGAPVQPLAVALIDLDDFKQVNDSLGHAAGDELLRLVGERLLSVARRSDTVARLGGDEFAILVRGAASPAELSALCGRLLDALAAPCEVFDLAIATRASIGIAVTSADGSGVDSVMNHADVALYEAKHSGGQRWCFFEPAMADAGRRRNALAASLRHAVERGEFSLVYQPQVSSGDGRVCGFEALLRWQHDEHGQVSPTEFIPIAEAAGLMPEIGAWVLAEACRQAALWPSGLTVSINVSAAQLEGKQSFIECVEEAAHGLRPETVELEITESALVDDVDGAVTTLRALRAKGFRVALDDFGTGYSALGYLRQLPFNTLKIDRSFIRDIVNDGESRVLVETILAMSRGFGMTAVAEGVERPEEAEMLRARGCDLLQGYLVSQPLAADQVGTFLAEWPKRAQDTLRLPAPHMA